MIRLLVVFLFFSVSVAHAELRKLAEADFGANATHFRSNLLSGADASFGWSRYGVLLSSHPAGTPIVHSWIPPCDICVGPRNPVITNETEGDQAESVLVINFRSPVKKVGMYVIGGNPPVVASIKASDRASNKIGLIKETVDATGAFIGLEAVDHRLISQVVLDYDSDQVPETVLDLAFEPESPPRFETVLPQIGHGQLAPDLLLKTTVTIVNISTTTAGGDIRFFDADGDALAPELEGGGHPDGVVPFSLGPGETQLVSTAGKAGVAGYARVVSSAPVQAVADFMVMTGQGEWTETAAMSVEGRFRAVGVYNHELPASVASAAVASPNKVGTALAVVNLAKDAAWIRVRQLDQDGGGEDRAFSLGPGEQFARFIGEIFGDKSVRGTIRFWSDRPIAAILIKTVNGLPVSILPLGSLED